MSDLADQQRGLYRKYALYRVEEGRAAVLCTDPFFALRYTSDPYARVALAAYADACEEQYPVLAADLRRVLVQR